MRKFEVGDRVRIIHSPRASVIGQVATIVSKLRPGLILSRDSGWFGVLKNGHPGHELDIPGVHPDGRLTGGAAFYPPEFLEPYYDGSEKVSWSDCVWKPKELGMTVWYGDHPRAKVTP